MPTIKDVAERAGVSVGTVSRVLSNHESVKASLRSRVNSAMAELDYRPNLAARALRTNRIDVIGLLVPDITNPFFAQLAKDVEMAAGRFGHSVMLANSLENAEVEERRMRALLERTPRGIIVVPTGDAAHLRVPVNVPCIALDRPYQGMTSIATDHENSAALAADHLIELGHRRIAYIAGPRDTAVGRQREKGFVTRLRAANVAGDAIQLTIREGAFDYASGDSIGRELMAMPANQRPTAIAAASDQQAIGVIRAARDLGLVVPTDLTVVGYDDITLASLVVPRLTTIRQPIADLANAAVRRIVEPDLRRDTTQFLGSLVLRSSSAPPSTKP